MTAKIQQYIRGSCRWSIKYEGLIENIEYFMRTFRLGD